MKHIKLNTFKELQNFFILWFGQSISQFGSAMTSYALIIWAYKQQGTVLSISWLSICTYIPYVLVSIFAGPLVERVSISGIKCGGFFNRSEKALQQSKWHAIALRLLCGSICPDFSNNDSKLLWCASCDSG